MPWCATPLFFLRDTAPKSRPINFLPSRASLPHPPGLTRPKTFHSSPSSASRARSKFYEFPRVPRSLANIAEKEVIKSCGFEQRESLLTRDDADSRAAALSLWSLLRRSPICRCWSAGRPPGIGWGNTTFLATASARRGARSVVRLNLPSRLSSALCGLSRGESMRRDSRMFGCVVTRPKKGRKEWVDDDGRREVGRVT